MNLHGEPVWYELMTMDMARANAFYSGLLDWQLVDSGMPEMDYHLAMNGTEAIAGFMHLTDNMREQGARPIWMPYFGVDDVDGAVETAVAGGAEVQLPAFDVPGVGRMAMLMHDHVGAFYVMRGDSEEASNAFAARAPMVGHAAWNELASSDPTAAKAFLEKIFGFEVNDTLDMGEHGLYEFLSIAGGAFAVGAVMPLFPGMAGSQWTVYFRVADIDEAVARVSANGGQVIAEPMEIPGGDYSLTAMDPDGAVFGCVGPRII